MENFKFELDFEEQLMQSTINKVLKKSYPSSELRKSVETNEMSKTVLKFLSDQGLLGMLNPLNQGGDTNLMICSIIATEAGKRLISFPLIEQLMSIYLLKEEGTSKDISQMESGGKIATIAWKQALIIDVLNGNHQVNGIIQSIPFANEADQIIVPIKRKTDEESDRVLILKTEDFRSQLNLIKTQDLTYPLYELKLNNQIIDENSIRLISMDLYNFSRLADLLIASELLGIAQEALEMTVNYTKERNQFGVEIAKFQAIKHMMADLHLLCESSRVSIEFGAWTIENAGEDHDIISSISKVYSSDAAIRIVENAIQIHGAVGFTWEHDLHFYLKRAYRLANIFKTPYEEREKVASRLEQASY